MIRHSVPIFNKLPYSIKYRKNLLKNANNNTVHIPVYNFYLKKRPFEENAKIITDYYKKHLSNKK